MQNVLRFKFLSLLFGNLQFSFKPKNIFFRCSWYRNFFLIYIILKFYNAHHFNKVLLNPSPIFVRLSVKVGCLVPQRYLCHQLTPIANQSPQSPSSGAFGVFMAHL